MLLFSHVKQNVYLCINHNVFICWFFLLLNPSISLFFRMPNSLFCLLHKRARTHTYTQTSYYIIWKVFQFDLNQREKQHIRTSSSRRLVIQITSKLNSKRINFFFSRFVSFRFISWKNACICKYYSTQIDCWLTEWQMKFSGTFNVR